MSKMLRLVANEQGATAIEYGLIASLIAIAALGAMQSVGTKVNSMFSTVSNAL
jgi:pilus assembly protein Flp/PilA